MTESESKLEIVNEDDISPDLDAAIRRLLCECFPADVATFSVTRHWNECLPAYASVFSTGGVPFGHLGIVLREILVGDAPIVIAGVQNVAVSPVMRGTGLSHRLEAAAMDEARRRSVSFGVLFCVPQLERLYASMGWITSGARVTMLDAQGRSVPGCSKSIMMVKQLGDEPFPAGDVDLQGRDW